MIILALFLFYVILYFFSIFQKIAEGKLEYLLLYICLGLPIYITLQSLTYKVFQTELLLTFIKLSKDFNFSLVFFFIFGIKNQYYKKIFIFFSR